MRIFRRHSRRDVAAPSNGVSLEGILQGLPLHLIQTLAVLHDSVDGIADMAAQLLPLGSRSALLAYGLAVEGDVIIDEETGRKEFRLTPLAFDVMAVAAMRLKDGELSLTLDELEAEVEGLVHRRDEWEPDSSVDAAIEDACNASHAAATAEPLGRLLERALEEPAERSKVAAAFGKLLEKATASSDRRIAPRVLDAIGKVIEDHPEAASYLLEQPTESDNPEIKAALGRFGLTLTDCITRYGGSLPRLREQNLQQVIRTLVQQGEVSRADLESGIGLPRPTVTSLLGDLEEAGLVELHSGEGEELGSIFEGDIGRERIALSPSAWAAVGVDIGHRVIRAAVADATGDLMTEPIETRHLDIDESPEAALAEAVRLIQDVLERAAVPLDSIRGVGVGVPGPVNDSGRVASPIILRNWGRLDKPIGEEIADRLEKALRYRFPVTVENDANLGALGELARGNGKGHKDFLYVKMSAGIGAGLISDGALFRGARGTAGEIGHSRATVPWNSLPLEADEAAAASHFESQLDSMPHCTTCGRPGCLEAIAGAGAIIERLHSLYPKTYELISSPKDLAECAMKDPGSPCSRAVSDAGRYLGVALAAIVNAFDSKLVVVGGPLSLTGDTLLKPIRDQLRNHTVLPVEVLPARHPRKAALYGAIELVRINFLLTSLQLQ